MKNITLTALYAFLLTQTLLTLVNAQPLSRNLGTIQAKGVGHGKGNRGDDPAGLAVPGAAVDDDDDNDGFLDEDDHLDDDDNDDELDDDDGIDDDDADDDDDDDDADDDDFDDDNIDDDNTTKPTPSPTLTPEPSAELSDTPSSTPTQTAAPTVTASDAPSSTPTITPLPTITASDAPSSTPTLTPSPSAEASDMPSSTPTVVLTSTGSPTISPSDVSTFRDNQSSLLDPVTRFLRPFAVRISVKESETATVEDIQSGLKLFLEQLLETKLSLVFSDLIAILLDVIVLNRSDGSGLFSITGKGFFDSTQVSAPSHAALQAAQMKVLSEFLFELEEMLKSNGIDVDTIVVMVSNDVKQDQGTSEKSSDSGQQDVALTFDDEEDGDGDGQETIVLGLQDGSSGSSSTYIVVASTLTVSLGLILLGIKQGFASKESEPVATRQPRENVMVVDADVSTNTDQPPV